MAISPLNRTASLRESGPSIGSRRGKWITANSDLKTTSGTLSQPHAVATEGAAWIEVPENATRVYIRGRVNLDADIANINANPAVIPICAAGTPDEATNQFSGTAGNANAGQFWRADSANLDADGIDIVLPTASTQGFLDSGGVDGDLTTLDGYDVLGASWLMLFVSSAVGFSSGGTNVTAEGQVLFL